MHIAHWFGLWTCLFACWELSQAYLGIHIILICLTLTIDHFMEL